MKRFLCVLLTLAILLLMSSCSLQESNSQPTASKSDSAGLTVHFINVEQGDSILLESAGEFVLIDAGERDYGEKVLAYIQKQGANSLKYVIATHPHSDHSGGIRTVLNGMKAEHFITSETDCDTFSWLKTLKLVDQLNIDYIDAKAGSTYSFGSADFSIMAPLSSGYEGYNNYSVVTKVVCGDISFLLTGDAEYESETEMLTANEDLSADVLKCGHHGSSDSTCDSFLKAVDPAFAVVSCGLNNEYGHPHRETVTRLKRIGCPMLRTDEAGTIVAHTDGTTLSFSSEKQDYSAYTYTAGDQKNNPEANGYVGNKNSLYFHYPDCDGVQTMSEKNKVLFQTREEAVGAGYKPCPSCRP